MFIIFIWRHSEAARNMPHKFALGTCNFHTAFGEILAQDLRQFPAGQPSHLIPSGNQWLVACGWGQGYFDCYLWGQ